MDFLKFHHFIISINVVVGFKKACEVNIVVIIFLDIKLATIVNCGFNTVRLIIVSTESVIYYQLPTAILYPPITCDMII